MRIHKLVLKNYRNHKDLELELGGESYLIRARNGAGKSNILEAIHLLATTKSLRSKYDVELIKHSETVAHIGTKALIGDEFTNLELAIAKTGSGENTSKKMTKINKVSKALHKFSGTLNSVMFAPTDIEIINGSPSLRRKYIDSIFYQFDKDYKKDHALFLKAVRQRNKVLEQIRDFGMGHDQLPYWTDKVLDLGSKIQHKRSALFEYINQHLENFVHDLNSKKTTCEIYYDINEISEERLEKYESAEVASKNTLVGPHRDDFSIMFDGHDVASFGSRGQQRTLVLALKLCEIEFLTKQTGHRPILLLDDIFSELDPEHKAAVDNIVNLQQTIITTAIDSTDSIELIKIA